MVKLKKRIFLFNILVIILIVISACSTYSTTLESNISVLSTEEEKLYHYYFDLHDIQKGELRARGYSEKVIAKMDNVDFEEAEKTWIISKEQVFYIKGSSPELQNVDISKWTNADVQAYWLSKYEKQKLERAPSQKQVAELEKRGISLEIAHQMLKEYINYDTLLTRTDEELNKFKEQIIEANKQWEDELRKRNEIRAKYIKSLDKR